MSQAKKVLDKLFGKPKVKAEIADEKPTCQLRWKKGKLQQLWEVEERRMHYLGDSYQYSEYFQKEQWRNV